MSRPTCSHGAAMTGRNAMVGQMICQLFSLAVILLCSLSISTCCALPFLHSPRPTTTGTATGTGTTAGTASVRRGQQSKSALMMSSLSSAGDDPAISVIRSLADYHEGEWRGRARSFTITPDVAAGVVQRKLSPEYTVAVKLTTPSASIDPSTKTATPPTAGTISLSETVSWGDNFSHRSIPLFTSSGILSSSASMSTSASSVVGDLDVDDVDASYSLDLTQPTDFPSVLSGLSGKSGSHTKRLKFVVEHCIAAGENRRCRCFAVYGEDESLLRVVISNETRVKKAGDDGAGLDDGKIGGKTNNMLSISDIIEMENDVDRLVDKIAAKMDRTSPPENKGDGSDDPNGDIDDGSSNSVPTEASRLDLIGKSVAGSKNAETAQDLSPYDISLLEVTNGVWLGDMIIRESPNVAASPTTGGPGKGFGQQSTSSSSSSAPASSASDESTRTLAEWDAGVQKVAWRWMWNFEEEIRQVVDAGKSLGSSMDDFMKKSLPGNVCVDESFSRRKPKDERMVYIDWGQDSVGFLLGSFFVRLPRYVNFDPSATTSRSVAVLKPFYTEFGIFQNGSPQNGVDSDGVVDVGEKSNAGEIFCSKIGRLYNFEGRLKQGCTSFFTFNRFDVDDGEEDDEDYDPYD